VNAPRDRANTIRPLAGSNEGASEEDGLGDAGAFTPWDAASPDVAGDDSDLPLLEVADGDVTHPLAANSKAVHVSTPTKRWVTLVDGITRASSGSRPCQDPLAGS
jgi:hypothetical protein